MVHISLETKILAKLTDEQILIKESLILKLKVFNEMLQCRERIATM